MRPSAATSEDETKCFFFLPFCSFAQTVSLLALLKERKKTNNKRCTFDTEKMFNSTFGRDCAHL